MLRICYVRAYGYGCVITFKDILNAISRSYLA